MRFRLRLLLLAAVGLIGLAAETAQARCCKASGGGFFQRLRDRRADHTGGSCTAGPAATSAEACDNGTCAQQPRRLLFGRR